MFLSTKTHNMADLATKADLLASERRIMAFLREIHGAAKMPPQEEDPVDQSSPCHCGQKTQMYNPSFHLDGTSVWGCDPSTRP